MEKTRCPLRLIIFKNYLFVWLNFTAESVNCSLFLKNLEKTFLQFDLKKRKKKTSSNTSKIYRNIYRKNLSTIIYRYRFKKLRFIGIAQGFFEVIDYRYRFSTERFIVPNTAYNPLHYYTGSMHKHLDNIEITKRSHIKKGEEKHSSKTYRLGLNLRYNRHSCFKRICDDFENFP